MTRKGLGIKPEPRPAVNAGFIWKSHDSCSVEPVARLNRRTAPTLQIALKSKYLSFINKNCLTNGIEGCIHCAMNANEISPKASPRLNRIQKISRILKVCVLFYFVVPLCVLAFNLKSIHLASGMVSVFNHPYASASDIPRLMYLLCATGTAVYLLGVISFYRLLCLYEKGVIFSGANVSEMKKLGSYLAGYGILAIAANVTYLGGFIFPWVLLEGFVSPWIVVGGAIYIVAGIMDEGRKIQEEQELTV